VLNGSSTLNLYDLGQGQRMKKGKQRFEGDGLIALALLLVLVLSGCTTLPVNLDNQSQDDEQGFTRQVEMSGQYHAVSKQLASTVFTKGDILQIRIQGMDQYDGLYKVNADGNIELPFSKSLNASGQSRASLITSIEEELVRLKWFYQDTVKVDASLVRMAAVDVAVFGAVFNPGRVSINNQPSQKQEDAIQQLSGEYAQGRDIVAALLAAGGLRPDADLSQIYIKRENQVTHIPLQRLLTGVGFTSTPSLISGDVVLVKSSGFENVQLIKPSQITPPGMRVFMSNLTAPALSNAQSSVGSDSTRMPYGSSLIDSAISANCIGATHHANASRSIILVTRNHGSKEQLVISRTINQLLRNSSNPSVNPFVMPNDGIACYDSRFTNFRDVARGLVEIVSPLLIGGGL